MGPPRAPDGSSARTPKDKGDKPEAPDPDPAVTADDPASPAGATPMPTPRFVSEAYFMEFKFEPGNYYLAGREQLDGQPVLRIEYYPTRMFNDNEDDKNKRGKGDSARETPGARAKARAVRPRA